MKEKDNTQSGQTKNEEKTLHINKKKRQTFKYDQVYK